MTLLEQVLSLTFPQSESGAHIAWTTCIMYGESPVESCCTMRKTPACTSFTVTGLGLNVISPALIPH
jgi:hypothetical protein